MTKSTSKIVSTHPFFFSTRKRSGALVNKSVSPYAIVGGIPAKLIRYRFEQEEIGYLSELKWWDKDFAWIEENAFLFADIKKLINKSSP